MPSTPGYSPLTPVHLKLALMGALGRASLKPLQIRVPLPLTKSNGPELCAQLPEYKNILVLWTLFQEFLGILGPLDPMEEGRNLVW